MGVVYRYTDLSDGIIKYVGIVWSNNRTLKQRDEEHRKNDVWCKNKRWRVEYLNIPITNRTDAEMLESHYISKFNTSEYFNIKKKDWGTSTILKDEFEWKLYCEDEQEEASLFSSIQELKEVAITKYCDSDYYNMIRFEFGNGLFSFFPLFNSITVFDDEFCFSVPSEDFYRMFLYYCTDENINLNDAIECFIDLSNRGHEAEITISEILGEIQSIIFYFDDTKDIVFLNYDYIPVLESVKVPHEVMHNFLEYIEKNGVCLSTSHFSSEYDSFNDFINNYRR